MAGRVFKMSIIMLLVPAICGVRASAQVECMPLVTRLSPCLGYITGNSLTTPTDICCAQVADIVKIQAQCLCSFLGSSTATQFGTIVHQALALSLPGACKIDNPFATRCSESQTPVPQSPKGSHETPASLPTNRSTTSAPSTPSESIIPAGSGKADESSAARASAKFMPSIFFFLLVASSTSIMSSF